LKITKTMGVLGTAAMASALLTACSTGDSGSTATTSAAAGGASQASNCPLVGAPDPGNSSPPAGVAAATSAPKVTKKDKYNIAFSQNASNNPWRLAETASFKSEAQKRGWNLTVTDANNDQAKQIQDVKGLIAQKPDALFIAPITEQLGNVVVDAAKAGVPVFLVDRAVDTKVAKPGQDFVSVMTSDFVQEGKRAAWAMANATGGKAQIIELEGTTGASPAIDRKKGFDEAIKACPDMKVVVSQDGDPAAVEPERQRHLRPQRRDGDRRHRRAQVRGQGAGQGRQARVDRRREGRPEGDPGRGAVRLGGVLAALRREGPRHDGGLRQR
jgi:ABC-type sugar transport system substrate-binding protein